MTRTALAEPNVLPNTQFILLPETANQLRDHALEQARHKMPLPLRQADLMDLLLRAADADSVAAAAEALRPFTEALDR